MSETAIAKEIVGELKAIRHELAYIKEHMVDADTILTPDEENKLAESVKAYKQGKAVKLEEFERQMGK